MMRNVVVLIFAVAMFAVACGGEDEAPPPAVSSPPGATVEAPAPSTPAPAAAEGECGAYAACCEAIDGVSGFEPLEAGCRNQPGDETDCGRRMNLMRGLAARNPRLPSECR